MKDDLLKKVKRAREHKDLMRVLLEEAADRFDDLHDQWLCVELEKRRKE